MNALWITNPGLARERPLARRCGPCRTAGNLSECADLAWAVAERRLDGSRGLQPTVGGKAKLLLRRGATPETGEGCIQASLRDACGWTRPEPWVKTHGYHQGTAPRCLDVRSRRGAGSDSAGFQPAVPPTGSRRTVRWFGRFANCGLGIQRGVKTTALQKLPRKGRGLDKLEASWI